MSESAPRRKWTKDSVVAAILNLPDGKRNPSSVVKSDASLYQIALRLYGKWSAALEAAGLEPSLEMRKVFVSRSDSEIIAAIRALPEDGRNALAVQNSNENLYSAARRRFDSWDAALIIAGFKPKQINQWGIGQQEGRTFEFILRDFLSMVSESWKYKGPRINKCVPDWRSTDGTTWLDAKLRSHGPDVDDCIKKYTPNVEKLIIVYVRGRRTETDRCLSDGKVEFVHISEMKHLCNSAEAVELFDKACSMEGSSYVWSSDEHAIAWTKERIIEKIRQMPVGSRHAKASKSTTGLYSSAGRLFGTWSNAVIAAGGVPVRSKKWTDSALISAILEIPKGQRNDGSVRVYNLSLNATAKKRWGSWPAALIAAGLDPEEECRYIKSPSYLKSKLSLTSPPDPVTHPSPTCLLDSSSVSP